MKMNLHEAREKIAAKLEELAAPIKEAGLTTVTRIIYTDKNLQEYSEFNEKCILIFGDIAIGTEELERDEYCNYSMCCEVKTALVNDAEIDTEINKLEGDVSAFLETLKASTVSPTELIDKINKEQEAEAEEAAKEFSKEMNKLRFKLLIGIGIVAAIIIALLIAIPLLT